MKCKGACAYVRFDKRKEDGEQEIVETERYESLRNIQDTQAVNIKVKSIITE